MEYQKMIESMPAEVFHNLRQAVELGKWSNGIVLTREQRENAIQAIIAWSEHHLPLQERPGYIDKGHKTGDSCDAPEETPLNWK